MKRKVFNDLTNNNNSHKKKFIDYKNVKNSVFDELDKLLNDLQTKSQNKENNNNNNLVKIKNDFLNNFNFNNNLKNNFNNNNSNSNENNSFSFGNNNLTYQNKNIFESNNKNSLLNDSIKMIEVKMESNNKNKTFSFADTNTKFNNSIKNFDSISNNNFYQKNNNNNNISMTININNINSQINSKEINNNNFHTNKINNNNNINNNNQPFQTIKKPSQNSLTNIDISQIFDENGNPISKTNNNISNATQTQTNPLQTFPLSLIIKYPKLNIIQQNCLELLYNTNFNSLITAPTGSGKTLLFEIAMARTIKLNFNYSSNNFYQKNFKIIYIAPIKSLCQEKTFDWKQKYYQHPLGLNVMECTGDNEFINMVQLNNANIVLTTPERFDILSRKWKENFNFLSNISLILIDEIHLLNEENRGGTIEAIVARLKLLMNHKKFQNTFLKNLRFIALSATIPNIPEVAEFLNVNNQGLKIFGEEFRPVKIEKIVLGFQRNKNQNEFMFEKSLDFRLANLIENYSEGKPTLIFCQTQKGAVNSAKQIVTEIQSGKILNISTKISPAKKLKLESISNSITNKSLSQFVKFGVGFHHAGLNLSDRSIIEENFKQQNIKIICTTSTLSQGVNLPARLVIIRSTNCYRGPKIGYTEYNKMEIDQMVGRAGRPQFDNKGIAIIMTEKNNVDNFLETSSANNIESHLNDNIVEHINAEISTGCITNVDDALIWLKNTFLFVRMKNNPNKFGIKNVKFNNNKNNINFIENYLKNLIHKIFTDLHNFDLIEYDSSTNSVKPKKLCIKMSKNYVMFDTMKNISTMLKNKESIKYNQSTFNQIEEYLIDILSNSKEFSKYSSKMEDRKTLNILNKDSLNSLGIKYKIKGPIDTFNKKSFVLIQSAINGNLLDEWELRRQQHEISQISLRVLKCIKEYCKNNNNCKAYIISIFLIKSIINEMWSENELIMKQIPKIGEKLARCFYKANLKSFEKILEMNNPRFIESICNKNPPFGNIILDEIKSIPKIEIKFEILKENNNQKYKICLNIFLPWEKFVSNKFGEKEFFDSYCTYHIIMTDNNKDNKIKFKKKIKPMNNNNNNNNNNKKVNYLFIYNIHKENFPINFFILNDKYFGLDKILVINNVYDKEGIVYSRYNENYKSFNNLINNIIKVGNEDENASVNKLNREINDNVILKEFFDDDENFNNNNENKNLEILDGEEIINVKINNNNNKGKNRKKKKKAKKNFNNDDINNVNNNSFDSDNLNNNINYGNHVDILQMVKNMKKEEINNKNKKLNIIKNYENYMNNINFSPIKNKENNNNPINNNKNNLSNMKTMEKTENKNKNKINKTIIEENPSTQNILNNLNKLSNKGVNLNFDFLDNFDNLNNNNNNSIFNILN